MHDKKKILFVLFSLTQRIRGKYGLDCNMVTVLHGNMVVLRYEQNIKVLIAIRVCVCT